MIWLPVPPTTSDGPVTVANAIDTTRSAPRLTPSAPKLRQSFPLLIAPSIPGETTAQPAADIRSYTLGSHGGLGASAPPQCAGRSRRGAQDLENRRAVLTERGGRESADRPARR